MAKLTIPYRKITANPSQLVDSPPACERTRLKTCQKNEEGQSAMYMTHGKKFQPAHKVDTADALNTDLMRMSDASRRTSELADAADWQLPKLIAEYWRIMAEYEQHPIHTTLLDDPDYARINASSKVIDKRARDIQMRILNTPARSGPEIGLKLDMILKDYEDCILPEDFIAMIAKDAHRLVAPVETERPADASYQYDPIPEYRAAFHAYDENKAASVERFTQASIAIHEWVPTTAVDMLRKVVVTLDDNASEPETSLPLLISQADRFLSEKP